MDNHSPARAREEDAQLAEAALADYLGHSDPGFTLRVYTI